MHAFIAVIHLNLLITYIQGQKEEKLSQKTVSHAVYLATEKNLIQKYLNGIGVKSSMIQEDQWQLEHGLIMI